MKAVAMTVCVLVLALVVGACGDKSSDRNAMEVKFQRIDYEMGNMENLNSAYGSQLTKATQRYIALVREYADELGPAEVKRRLAQKRDEVAPYCLPCSATLDFEASRY
jgi:ABC-type Fe3+-citrate transport system substrate-binding protein